MVQILPIYKDSTSMIFIIGHKPQNNILFSVYFIWVGAPHRHCILCVCVCCYALPELICSTYWCKQENGLFHAQGVCVKKHGVSGT